MVAFGGVTIVLDFDDFDIILAPRLTLKRLERSECISFLVKEKRPG